MSAPCDRCGRTFANAGPRATHVRSCGILSPRQMAVLEALRDSGGKQSDVSVVLGISDGTVSKVVKVIRAQGLMPADVAVLLNWRKPKAPTVRLPNGMCPGPAIGRDGEHCANCSRRVEMGPLGAHHKMTRDSRSQMANTIQTPAQREQASAVVREVAARIKARGEAPVPVMEHVESFDARRLRLAAARHKAAWAQRTGAA